jgi:hypothetical protein
MKDYIITVLAGISFVAVSIGIIHLLNALEADVLVTWFLSGIFHFALVAVVVIIVVVREDLL